MSINQLLGLVNEQDLYEFNEEFQVFICPQSTCVSARSPSKLVTHMTQTHPVLWNNSKKSMQDIIRQLAREFPDYKIQDLPYPSPGHTAIPHLPCFDGFRCLQCAYTTTNVVLMKSHSRQQHSDHDDNAMTSLIFTKATLQRWTQARNASGYFWITPSAKTTTRLNVHSIDNAENFCPAEPPPLNSSLPWLADLFPPKPNSSALELQFQQTLQELYTEPTVVKVLEADEHTP